VSAPRDPLLALVDVALAEDIGTGDWTTRWTVSPDRVATARIVAKETGRIAGTEVARLAFLRVDRNLEIDVRVLDGESVADGVEVTRISGSARSILTAERVALNFLQRLSGVATITAAFVERLHGTHARILDTRKTTPGLRRLEKEAVLAGGGHNHRHGLYDMVLVKENHIRAAGGITAALEAVRRENDAGLAVEVETTNLDEVWEALGLGVDRILFDNMPLPLLREAVQIARRAAPEVETEASGGVTLDTIRDIAETGVDFVSVGAITHSAPALDLSLLVEPDA
jgi:nicotinate-nucleotide pyrophosphorylase (carboxylating)